LSSASSSGEADAIEMAFDREIETPCLLIPLPSDWPIQQSPLDFKRPGNLLNRKTALLTLPQTAGSKSTPESLVALFGIRTYPSPQTSSVPYASKICSYRGDTDRELGETVAGSVERFF